MSERLSSRVFALASSVALAVVLGVVLCACATAYSPSGLKTGDGPEAITQQLGQPTARYPRADGGSRLEYARGPLGRDTYMVDVDVQGRLVAWHQVLDDAHFAAVQPGMTSRELLMLLGHPSETWGVRYHGQTVWSYRYANHDCLWFSVGVSPAGIVEDAGYGTDSRCERREKD